jgi:hypothetical protein
MRQQILSRTRLQHIIAQFGLYKEANKINPDEVVEQMRKDIKTELVEAPGRRGQLTAFKISYTAPSARLAQQVNEQLTSLFIDQNIEEQSQRTESTTEFFSSELDAARARHAEQEGKTKKHRTTSQPDGDERPYTIRLARQAAQLEPGIEPRPGAEALLRIAAHAIPVGKG